MEYDIVRHLLKIFIILAAIGLFLFYRVCERNDIKRPRPWLAGVLAVLAALSVYAYFDFGVYPKFGQFMNPHDFYHYYMGAKYSPEVGYLDLYNCTVVADAESRRGKPYATAVRRMDNYRFEPTGAVMARRAQYRALFTDKRWEAFKKDLKYFERILGPGRWRTVVKDKGYNATPVWNMVARLITWSVSTHGPPGVSALVALDLMLLMVMFIMIGWAFGWRASLFSVIFFGTMFMMAYTHIRGAFLRMDWLSMLVMSTCLIKRKHYKTAGVLMAYAGLARMFPLVFVFGLGVKFLFDLIKTRRLRRSYLEFFCAFGAMLAVLGITSVIVDGGMDHWRAFFTKIELHDGDLSPIRVGFKYIFLMAYKNAYGAWMPFERAKLDTFADLRLLWWAIQFAVIGISVYLVRHLDDYETIPYGYALAFFLTAPTFYYQVMIMVAFLLFLPKADDLMRAVGVVCMFGLSIVMYILNAFWKLGLPLSFTLSCMLMLLALYIMTTTALVPFRTTAGPPVLPEEAPETDTQEKPRPKPKHKAARKNTGKKRKKRRSS